MPAAEPYKNHELPLEARVDDLIARLTLAEKIDCLSTNPSVPRLGIVASGHVEGLHGLAQGTPGAWGGDSPIPTTTFPQAIGLGETWDPKLVRKAAALEGKEARWIFHQHGGKRGGLVIRAPNADLGRDPRWGRTEECFGEDAFYCGVMTQAVVRGLQGDHPTYWQSASLMKHFLANSNEVGRERGNSGFDERMFREYYSVPFRKGIEAGSRAFMAAYNKYNGVPCCLHPVLEEVTRAEWGHDGIICTDGGAFRLLVEEHRYFPTLIDAAGPVLGAGITQFLDEYREAVEGALEEGSLTEAEIDRAIRPNFRVMIRLGLLDPPERVPYTRIDATPPWETDEARALAREVTEASIVLLKNEGALLPLAADGLRSVAVIGPRADEVLFDWYSGSPPYAVSPLEGIRARLGPGVEVRHAREGAEAIAAAKASDVAIVCVGNHPTGEGPFGKSAHPSYGKESVDRLDLALPDEPFLAEVLAANPKTVVVLLASFPYSIVETTERAPAIVKMTHNSQELGTALAGVLFGDLNPGGRLVQTWHRSVSELPPMLDYDLRLGRTYMFFEGEPLFAFGFGLSYTTFGYEAFRIERASGGDARESRGAAAGGGATAGPGDVIEASVRVTNTGKRAGDDVVQLYARYARSHVTRAKKQLVAFERLRLAPGETTLVSLSFPVSELAFWDVTRRAFVVEAGKVELELGRSAAEVVAGASLEIAAA